MKNNFGYIFLAYASLFCYGLLDNSRGPAYPAMLSWFGLSMSKGALIFALSSLAGLPVIASGRIWLKGLGEFNSQRIFLLLVALGCAGIGASGYINNGYSVLLAASVVFGLGFGGTTITSNLLVAFGSRAGASRRLFAGLHTMYGLSSVLAPVVYSVAADNGLDWRILFILLSIMPFAAILVSIGGKQIRHEVSSVIKPKGLKISMRIIIGAALACYAAAEVAISSRLVLFVSRTQGIGDVEAANYLSLFFVLLLAGRFLFFVVPIHISSARLLLTSATASFFLYLGGIFIHPIMLSLCGLTMSFYFPCGVDWVSQKFGEATGYIMTSVMTSVAVTMFAMHWILGASADAFGLKIAMIIGPVFLLMAGGAVVAARNIGARVKEILAT